MREAYLVNNSQSVVNLPLFGTVPAVVNGRNVNQLRYAKLVPKQELLVGEDISVEAQKHYLKFKAIMIDLVFRTKIEEPKTPETPEEPEKPAVPETPEQQAPEFTEQELMKKRQAELIELAASLGIEATTQEPKAVIVSKILGKK